MAKDEEVKVIVLGRDDCAIIYRGGEKEDFEVILSNPIGRKVGAGWELIAILNILMKEADDDFIKLLTAKKTEYEKKITSKIEGVIDNLMQMVESIPKDNTGDDDPKVVDVRKKIEAMFKRDIPPYKLND